MKPSRHTIWGSRSTFILAATGSAVGLGNIWKFPYITGENGGGAFVLVYLACVAIIGIPLMTAEILLGRRARANPIKAVQTISRDSGLLRGWNVIGWMGVIAAFLILSYYTVIAGWTLEYFKLALNNRFAGLNGEASGQMFDEFLANRSLLVQWQTAFICMTALVLMFGVKKGLGVAVRTLMPLMFILLLLLVGYAAYAGDFAAGASFMFSFNPQSLSVRSALIALGHAFFTLSLGMGAIMAYGAYMPGAYGIGKSVIVVALLDTGVALLAGLAIFSLVFATPGVAPGEGPGLMFVTLPIAFGAMPLGMVFGSIFFAVVILAAWSSTIALLEPAVAYLTERFRFHRISACLLISLAAWLLGLGTVFSFNIWVDKKILWDLNFFGLIDFVTTNIILPLGGLLTAVYVGWRVRLRVVRRELHADSKRFVRIWYVLLRYVSPLAVLIVLLSGLYPLLKNFFVEL